MKRPFFDTTIEALNAITALYDFLWPTAAAIWNLRWQVAGYCTVRPAASVPELQARFIEGSRIHGANLKRACIETSWDEQTAILAGVLLTNLFAIYEGWAKRIVRFLGKPESVAKKLAYYNVSATLQALQSPISDVLEKTVYPVLTALQGYDLRSVDNHVTAYRYFKEIRNKQLHDHGIADQVCERAYWRFATVANPTALGVVEVPEHVPVVAGQPVQITLRGVVGFSGILRHMIYTIDAELARAKAAEPALDTLWLRHRPSTKLFKAERAARHRQIRHAFKKMGFAGVNVTNDVEQALVARALVRYL